MAEQDYDESWSSEGDSISSDSFSSDSETSSASNNDSHQSSDNIKGIRYLKRAGIFTREEVIEQAINRWSAYIRLCGRAMTSLRDAMVEAYIKETVDAKGWSNSTGSMETISGGATGKVTTIAGSEDMSAESGHSTVASNHRSAELRALRRFGRHSSRVENAKRAAAVSKFAIMSTRLAPWQRSGGGQQSCKYRDPTTTTWEHRCSRPCVPLLPYCAAHLVLSEDIPPPLQTPSMTATASTTPFRDIESGCGTGEGEGTLVVMTSMPKTPAPNKPQKPPSRKALSNKARSTNDGAASQSDVQFPPQFLFRKCGGGPNKDCMEPVIAWTATTRCPQHTDLNSIFPVAKNDQGHGGLVEQFQASTSHLQQALSSSAHPLLMEYLQKRRRHDHAFQ